MKRSAHSLLCLPDYFFIKLELCLYENVINRTDCIVEILIAYANDNVEF